MRKTHPYEYRVTLTLRNTKSQPNSKTERDELPRVLDVSGKLLSPGNTVQPEKPEKERSHQRTRTAKRCFQRTKCSCPLPGGTCELFNRLRGAGDDKNNEPQSDEIGQDSDLHEKLKFIHPQLHENRKNRLTHDTSVMSIIPLW